jgi:hypothetical protein
MARYNSLKRRALAAFEGRGWLRPTTWAVLARFFPSRAAYSYLLRLHRFGLLHRRKGPGGVLYRLSERGRGRLAWLERFGV